MSKKKNTGNIQKNGKIKKIDNIVLCAAKIAFSIVIMELLYISLNLCGAGGSPRLVPLMLEYAAAAAVVILGGVVLWEYVKDKL